MKIDDYSMMAQLSCLDESINATSIIRILSSSIKENEYIAYTMLIQLGDVKWTLEKRYRDFENFAKEHRTELRQYFDKKEHRNRKIPQLPKKRIIGNKDVAFVCERRTELEKYLRDIFLFDVNIARLQQQHCVSSALARFLSLNIYEVRSIVEQLVENISRHERKTKFKASPLLLHALTVRANLLDGTIARQQPLDLGNVFDFSQQLEILEIIGSSAAKGSSNIKPNDLVYSLEPFKNLNVLWMTDCNPHNQKGKHSVRQSIKKLICHYTLNRMSDLLVDNADDQDDPLPTWHKCTIVDLSFNWLTTIDRSVTALRYIERLHLGNNCITDIGKHLVDLPRLRYLDLSYNGIESAHDWHLLLANVTRLVVAFNSLRTLNGLSRLKSLEYLDARHNALVEINDVTPLGNLPILTTLLLEENPVTSSVDYRTRVLVAFGNRASEVKLDARRATAKEVEIINLRLTIHTAREERERLVEKSRLQLAQHLDIAASSNELRSEVDT